MIYNEGYGSFPDTSYITRAAGSRVWDLGGRELIDLALGGGSMILGHAHPSVVDAVREQVGRGSIFTAPHAAVHEVDKYLDGFIPWLPGRLWCNSGSEAVMRLVRIARAVTGKRKIGLFSGCWHGSWDGTLVEEDYSEVWPGSPHMKLRSAGTPQEVLDSIVFLPYWDYTAMDLIREHAGELACVLIEPVQGSNPQDDVGMFLAGLRSTCSTSGVLLAMDEVVTGFRLARGGGQEYFGVHADLAAYGKVLGGGLPVGMVAGTQVIMDQARALGVFFGGTFSANPLTIATSLATLRQLTPEVYTHLSRLGRALQSEVNLASRFCGLPIHMMGAGSIHRLILSPTPITSRRERDRVEPDSAAQLAYYGLVRQAGVHIGTNRIQFLSTAHTMMDVVKISRALCDSAREWRKES